MRELTFNECSIVSGSYGGLLGGQFVDAIHGGAVLMALGSGLGSAVGAKWAGGGGIVIGAIAKGIGAAAGFAMGALAGAAGILYGYKDGMDLFYEWLPYVVQGNGGTIGLGGGIS